MARGAAGGVYRAVLRGGQWVVRSPDNKTVKECGTGIAGHAEAVKEAARYNDKLRPN